ncbi:hypothetical protein SUGI_0504290 [Cryptomeria japonica]|uniref:uncharacterized protein LOC131034896 n=1 Tax=Cryptomeria japonica TaxID=3369 RepID=UPI002408E3DB|nr:uncharacterized protein LOC131034896 [Cryptomeria japonica]GLJ26243.1 hypothetical protein SUGI_0504290 [Cryptomeria japonica]
MAARNGAFSFSRTARSAFNSFRTSSNSTRPPRRGRNLFENNGSQDMKRRRYAGTMVPLHDAVSSAKLVTRLSVNSRSCRGLSPGLQGYFYPSFQLCTLCRS